MRHRQFNQQLMTNVKFNDESPTCSLFGRLVLILDVNDDLRYVGIAVLLFFLSVVGVVATDVTVSGLLRRMKPTGRARPGAPRGSIGAAGASFGFSSIAISKSAIVKWISGPTSYTPPM